MTTGVRALTLLFATLTVGSVSGLQAQSAGRGCRFLPGSGTAQRAQYADGAIVTAIRPDIACDDGRRMQADSVVYYQATGLGQFYGNVYFEDDQQSLVADTATYFENTGLLRARGSVDVTDLADGTAISGEALDYYRAGGTRTEAEITVFGGRPQALLRTAAPDSAAPLPTPWDITADRIFLRGDSYFEARGDVQAVRDSIRTSSDSLVYNQASGTLWLVGDARIEQGETVMTGRRLRARIPEDEIDELVAYGQGTLRAEDLDLDAPWIRVSFRDGELYGLWAAPLVRQAQAAAPDSLGSDDPSVISSETPAQDPMDDLDAGTPLDSLDSQQPLALAEGTTIRADSLDVRAPGQRLDRVLAVGRAYAISEARDSLNTDRTPDMVRRDWIRGDTITVIFAESTPASGEPGDSASYVIEQLVAVGNASSLYRIPADSVSPDSTTSEPEAAEPPEPTRADTLDMRPEGLPTDSLAGPTPLPRDEPGIHYVVARQIILNFIDGEIRTMVVDGLTEGAHLQPIRAGARGEAGDTVRARPPDGGDHE